jgi:hypothetical protein
VDLIHQDLKATIQDLVDLLRVQLLGEGGVRGHIGEEDGDDLALALYGRAVTEDLVCEVLGGVGGGAGGVEGRRGFLGSYEVMTTLVAKETARGVDFAALATRTCEGISTAIAKPGLLGILKLTPLALDRHFLVSWKELLRSRCALPDKGEAEG